MRAFPARSPLALDRRAAAWDRLRRWKGQGRVARAIPEFPNYESGRASGVAVLSGYRLRVYLSDAAGQDGNTWSRVELPAQVVGAAAAALLSERCEATVDLLDVTRTQ